MPVYSSVIVLQNARSWQRLFLITGSVHLSSVMLYMVFGSGRQQDWAQGSYANLVSSDSDSTSAYGSVDKNPTDLSISVHNKNKNPTDLSISVHNSDEKRKHDNADFVTYHKTRE